MSQRAVGFGALLAVIAASIVFGMIVGGQLNAPQVASAATAAGSLELLPPSTEPSIHADFSQIVENALPAVVSVHSVQARQERDGRQRMPLIPREWPFRQFGLPLEPQEPDPRNRNSPPIEGEGSGFIIDPDGYVLTNNHVVENSDKVMVRLAAGKEYPATVVGTDPSIDLALLKIDVPGSRLPTLPLGDSNTARVGEWVIAIGNPLGVDQTVTVGVISGKERRLQIGSTDQGVVSFIQTDAAINFGNSGGPLLDARGNVIGINTAIRRVNFAEGIGFALPISQVKSVVEQLKSQGFVRRGFIGITMNPEGIDEVARDYYGLPDTRGVIVSELRPPDGPAAQAGVKPGDVIRKVDDEAVADNLSLISKIASRKPGDRVRLEVFRQGKTLRLEATLADRNAELQADAGAPSDRRAPVVPEGPSESTGLGLTVEDLDVTSRDQLGLADSQRGVLITDVEPGSDASRRVQADMIVTAINDRPIAGVADWNRVLGELRPGAAVKLTLMIPPAQPGGDGRVVFAYLKAP